MWFKNLRLYRFTEKLQLTEQELNDALEQHAFQPCGKLDPTRYGFVPPLGRHGSEYIHSTNGYIMICAKRQDKILPSGVIKEHLEEEVLKITAEEGRNVSRKERDSLKDEIIFDLLPKAFTKNSLDFAYIATREKLFVVNAGSDKRAEDLISALRDAVGSLKLVPIVPKAIPTQVLTHAIKETNLGEKFEIGEECEFRASKDERVVACRKHDLSADEIINHIDCGMIVSKMSACWNEAIHFVIDDKFAIKRLKFEDAIHEKAADRNPESFAEEFDANFAIMTTELSAFIKDLLNTFGGVESESSAAKIDKNAKKSVPEPA